MYVFAREGFAFVSSGVDEMEQQTTEATVFYREVCV